MIYKCINCKREFDKKEELFKACTKCNFVNYNIDDIPIIVENPNDYISNKLIAYTLYIDGLENTIKSLKQSKNSNDRTFKSIEIIEAKIKLVKDIRKELIPFCDIENLLSKSLNYTTQGYDISYEYLLRDWGNFKESEKEISTIYKHIKSKLNSINNSNVLILGAGLGRLAVELIKDFEHVYAIDLSYEMPAMFNKIKDSSFELDFLLLKNSLYNDKNHLKSKIENSKIIEVAGCKEKLRCIDYFVSNVTNLPFGNASMDAIVSCYFTDIIPIDEYYGELNRVLKENGVFIHFGPLDYHFENQNKMLTISELINFFEQREYDVEDYEPILLEHISIPIQGLKRIYNNWFFKAKKRPHLYELNYSSIVKLKEIVDFEITGCLKEGMDTVNIQKVNIRTPLGNIYECTMDTINLLEKIDGKRQLSEIFSEIENDFYIDKKLKETALRIIDELIKNQLLSIIIT